MGSLLQLIGERSDQQIATEPQRRSGAIQLLPGKPQFVRRPIHQAGNLAVDLGDVRITRSVGLVAVSTWNRRKIVNWAVSSAARSAVRETRAPGPCGRARG